ncbi:xylulokinase [Providencia sneebia]|uniref:Xylulose kinase n=1 Tax=Providencia sneebia DSM 19967 TaxID=1141660 RepID=K8WMD7_9GAMM|nr:xylulokinase [Providencia sneebia]EKT57315.1 xylulokinase [Providencia sneebia DSM 19967]
MYLGIDLGTSGVKVVLLNQQGHVEATRSVPLSVSRPFPLWSEQDPEQWWQATQQAILSLSEQHPLENLQAIGLSGQMHGATLLDAQNNVLRPAILWNDGRCETECHELAQIVPNYLELTGNLLMPGFTAPKLQWVKNHEPDIFKKIAKVLLPKDYLRWKLTGDFATDMSDASGTLWLDVKNRCWSQTMLDATGLTLLQMPKLYEGTQITGYLHESLANLWNIPRVPIVAGAGDNAAGAIGVGLCHPQQALLSLGTSGVYFVVTDGYLSSPENGLHSFCHALPNQWHLMSVILSAASCLDWVAALTGLSSVEALFDEIQSCSPDTPPLWFLPYLSGERTPHNNPNAKGAFWGLTHQHKRADLCKAVVEGVSFALAQGIDILHETGVKPTSITLIGGGSRSPYWRQLLADIIGITIDYRDGGEVGPALGAARLARVAMMPNTDIKELLPQPNIIAQYQPTPQKHHDFLNQRKIFAELYQQTKIFTQ